ncbi:integrase, partial [Streptomyces sp. A73]|nr:integrase [Streptomyces sp. A73]
MPYIEWRGDTVRVKWWGGEYTASGKKRYESASGPGPGDRFRDENEAYEYGLDRESDVRNLRHVSRHSGRIA